MRKFLEKYDNRRISHFIPALNMPFHMGSSKTMIYFHANAEDIVLSHDLLDYMRVLLRVNIIAIEYPGYGLYSESHQKRYKYPNNINSTLKYKLMQLNDLQYKNKKSRQNFVKEARQNTQKGSF